MQGLRNIAPDKAAAAYSHSKDLLWFGPFQFVAIVGKGDGQAVCRGASAETDIVGRLGIVDSWDGTTFIAGLAAMMFYATAMLIGNSVGKNTFRNRKQRR